LRADTGKKNGDFSENDGFFCCFAYMPNNVQRKREGFQGQRLIVLPKKIISDFLIEDPVTRQVYITDIGYYPKAAHHYMQRPSGTGEHILIYCVEGNGWVEMEKTRVDISPSQFIVIPAGVPHRYASEESHPWTIYWVHFSGETAAFIVSLIRQSAPQQQPKLSFNENRLRLFEEICSNLEKGYSTDNLRYVNMIFYHFLSSLLYEEKFNSSANKKDRDIIEVTITLMQKKVHTVISLTDLAKTACLSVSHYSAVFRRRTGYAPIEYFNHLKIQKACQYLQFTSMSVKETACMLGIDDPYYFSRMFTRLMGQSPTDYRKGKQSA
jgi:AraC-like DNA-binding protein/mannose-6-phosphate isomerase-like protein (cupin superfamily)